MKLKPVYDSMEEVPEELKSFYETRDSDGKAVLALDGLPPGTVSNERLQEFRDTNIELMEANKKLEAELSGVMERMGELDELRKKIEASEDADLIKEGRMDELVERKLERRVAEMKREYDGQVTALTKARDQAEQRAQTAETGWHGLMIDQALSDALDGIAVPRKGALGDIKSRAKGVWRVKDNRLVPMENDQIIYGADGSTMMTMTQYVEGLLSTASHLFEESTGGGGKGTKKPDTPLGAKKIPHGDPRAFGDNLEAIAKGDVEVVRAAP